ncbi:type VII secretion target [Actinokineospora enzanensis]|uniref:type VII secretion target n=1 Tax=Actinokineospora enzanensis TaxID=155975 RepID=UPI000374AFD0|nr:type VII secretion target [Actinokineospora enzanensis]
MTFHVEPTKLDVCQQTLSPELSGQIGRAKGYQDQHLNLSMWEKGPVGQGIWATAISRMGEARDAVAANLDKLDELCTGSAAELGKAAAMYRRTDAAEAARLDDT